MKAIPADTKRDAGCCSSRKFAFAHLMAWRGMSARQVQRHGMRSGALKRDTEVRTDFGPEVYPPSPLSCDPAPRTLQHHQHVPAPWLMLADGPCTALQVGTCCRPRKLQTLCSQTERLE